MKPVSHLLLSFIFSLASTSFALGQTKPPPAPISLELKTIDGVLLYATYYGSTQGRHAPIAVLIGDKSKSRAILEPLALHLQSPRPSTEDADNKADPLSWAVLAVDLRGQGDSVHQQRPNSQPQDLSNLQLSRAVLTAMVQLDMEAVRRELVDRNDTGEINLNRLAYVGVGMGALVATNAAAVDWSVQKLNASKQGEDVKGLVLISPPWNIKGVGMLNALRQPGVRSEVATLLLYGKENRRSAADAERIYKQLEKGHPDSGSEETDSLPSLFKVGGPSSLKGSAWLKENGQNAEQVISQFLDQHVAGPDLPWTQRRLN